MPLSAYVSVWLLGLLGGVHCAGMCGGFVAAATGAQRVHFGRAAVYLHALPYHAGRLATYSFAGAVMGALGAGAGRVSSWLPLQNAMFLLGNALLIALGVMYALRGTGLPGLERVGAAAFRLLSPLTRKLAGSTAWPGRVALGMAWGLIPCGMVYSVLAV